MLIVHTGAGLSPHSAKWAPPLLSSPAPIIPPSTFPHPLLWPIPHCFTFPHIRSLSFSSRLTRLPFLHLRLPPYLPALLTAVEQHSKVGGGVGSFDHWTGGRRGRLGGDGRIRQRDEGSAVFPAPWFISLTHSSGRRTNIWLKILGGVGRGWGGGVLVGEASGGSCFNPTWIHPDTHTDTHTHDKGL